CVCGLVRVGGEEPPAAESSLERDVDGGTRRLESAAASGGLAQRTGDLVTVLIEDEDVGRHRVVGRCDATEDRVVLVVAAAGQAVPGFEHVHLERVRAADERD